MSEWLVPPALYLFAGIPLLAIAGQRTRLLLILGLPLLTLWAVWHAPATLPSLSIKAMGYTLSPLAPSDVGRLFASAFALMLLGGGLFAWKTASRVELCAAYLCAGSAIGVTFAGDLISLFLFWELMTLGSTLILWSANTPAARRAAMRYLLLHLFGSLLLMLGITGHVLSTSSIAFVAMQTDSVPHWLILAGFLLNAGAPPFSAWVADAYPRASPSGGVFLSAFTTKTAVFVLIMGFPGEAVLIPIGIYMIFYGIFYALLENDIRRMLAYSIVNQVGFMLTAIGIGSELALNGAVAHAFAHIIYKGLLLMAAGSVMLQTGKRRLTDLGGLFQSMPWTALLGSIGALSALAFPLTSGFTTKSMIWQASADAHLLWVWLALTAASAGVALHAGLKFPWFVFFHKDAGLRPPDPARPMLIAMGLFALLCFGLGIYPAPLYALLPYPVDYAAYTAAHVISQLQLLLFAGLVFFLMLPLMQRSQTISLDLDWFYRRLLPALWHGLEHSARILIAYLHQALRRAARHLYQTLLAHHGPHGTLARHWPIGSMALWVAVMLLISLLTYFAHPF